ncbi:MAG: asparagine synthase-related protein [Nitrospiraceae bacterium]|nr:asparagine synthase-related protein [Nitrospiraceae bacterium]
MSRVIEGMPVLLKKSETSSFWEDREYRVYWEGLAFIEGIPSGGDSMRAFVGRLAKDGIEGASRLLKGIYFIAVERKEGGDLFLFVDNSGLYQAFYTDDSVSTSFLGLIRRKGYTVADLDARAVVEFLQFGNLFSGKTFFRAVRKIPPEIIIHLSRDGGMEILNKKPPDPDARMKATPSFNELFEHLAVSLSNRKVSVDLTGGVDSRLIAVMLDSFGLKFETAISGGTPVYEDILISEQVARSIGHPWYGTVHSVSFLEDGVSNAFKASEGLCDVLFYHRLYQLQEARRGRGIDTVISGVGGELFKDYWWLQDFPFYSSRSSNVERLVDLRIMPQTPMEDILTADYAEQCRLLKMKVVEELSSYVLETNTQTYDNIYANYMMREQAGRILTAHSHLLSCYAPYLDQDMVMIGCGLPRKTRFFNAFHRGKISALNPLAAGIPTTEGGISVSSDAGKILCDLPKFAVNRMGRLLVKMNLRKRAAEYRSHPELYVQARNMEMMKESIATLRHEGIVRNGVDSAMIQDGCLGTLLSLGLFIDLLNRNSRDRDHR